MIASLPGVAVGLFLVHNRCFMSSHNKVDFRLEKNAHPFYWNVLFSQLAGTDEESFCGHVLV